jgi:hypothetical protein
MVEYPLLPTCVESRDAAVLARYRSNYGTGDRRPPDFQFAPRRQPDAVIAKYPPRSTPKKAGAGGADGNDRLQREKSKAGGPRM